MSAAARRRARAFSSQAYLGRFRQALEPSPPGPLGPRARPGRYRVLRFSARRGFDLVHHRSFLTREHLERMFDVDLKWRSLALRPHREWSVRELG